MDQLVKAFAELHDYRGRVFSFIGQVAGMPPLQTDKLVEARQGILNMQKAGQSLFNKFNEIEKYPQLFEGQDDTRSVTQKAVALRDEVVSALNDSLIQLRRQEDAVNLLEKIRGEVTPDFLAVLTTFLQLWEPVQQWNDKQQLPITETSAEETLRLNTEVDQFLYSWKKLPIRRHMTFNHLLGGNSSDIPAQALLAYSAAHKKQVERQWYQTTQSLTGRRKALENFSESFEKMLQYFEVFTFIAPIAKPQFAELLSRLVVLRRDIEEAKKDFRMHPNQQATLRHQFDNKEENPCNFKARFEALEEAMHKLSASDIQKWQQAINQKLSLQNPSAESPLHALKDIAAYCSDLGFEMRYMEEAVSKGAFPYKSLKAFKDYCLSYTSYKPGSFNWRGPA